VVVPTPTESGLQCTNGMSNSHRSSRVANAGVVVAVGPEGGFSDVEVQRAASAGATVASLGPAVLRTETAAVIGSALVLARYGRLG